MKSVKTNNLLILGALLALLPYGLHAAEPEDIIKYRKNVMKAIGGHTSAAGLIVEGKVEHKRQLPDHARALQILTSDVPALFPKDSDFGETRAKDEVWSKRADFEKAAQNTKTKATAFAKAVQGGNQSAIATSFKELGQSCKACHDDFRKKEE